MSPSLPPRHVKRDRRNSLAAILMDKVVLLVEDNADDVFLLQEAMKIHCVAATLVVLDDGEKAIQWIKQNDLADQRVSPSAVILDLNLPKRNGAEVLDVLRASDSLNQTPVIIFSSSTSERDRSLRDRYPHTSYVCKSADFDEFANIGGALKLVLEPPPAAQ